MTHDQFELLKVGDKVTLNKRCHGNAGVKCIVTYILSDEDRTECRICVETASKKPELSLDGKPEYDWNEISYACADVGWFN